LLRAQLDARGVAVARHTRHAAERDERASDGQQQEERGDQDPGGTESSDICT
jgi:hypothetical protein